MKKIKSSGNVEVARVVPVHVQFVEKMKQCYEENTHQLFNDTEKMYVLAYRLINKFGVKAVAEKAVLLAQACESSNRFYTKEGWANFSIETLSSHWNRLLPVNSLDDKWEKIFKEDK